MTTTSSYVVVSRLDAIEQSMRQLAEAFHKLYPEAGGSNGERLKPDDINTRIPLSQRETPLDIPWVERQTPVLGSTSDDREILDLLFASIDDIVVFLDPTGHVTRWSSGAARLFGWSATEAVGVPPMFISADLQSMPIGEAECCFAAQRQDQTQIYIGMIAREIPSGRMLKIREVPSASEPQMSSGSMLALPNPMPGSEHSNFNDPELIRILTVGQLAEGVAHDVMNLISVISGYSQLVNEYLIDNDPSRELVSTIDELSHQAGDLLRYLTGQSKKAPLPDHLIAIDDLFERLKRLMPRFAGFKYELAIECNVGTSKVRAEMIDLIRLMMNLVSNARNSMPDGGRIQLAAAMEEFFRPHSGWPNVVPAGKYVVLVVSDLGKGMQADVMTQIFDPHFTTRPHEGGKGIGMSVVSDVVNSIHGFIQVNSIPGWGTTVRVYVPVVE